MINSLADQVELEDNGSKIIRFFYIPDKEINLENKDLLGAKPYVETLSEIIRKTNTPFTIGLFGGWGVGKSSIIKTE